MARLEEAGKQAPKAPSFIRQTIQLNNKEQIPTKTAAKYLGISEKPL